MHSKPQFHYSALSIIVVAAAVGLFVLLAVVSAKSQSAVPRTAREAAQMPEFAQRLARPGSPAIAGNPPTSSQRRGHRGDSPQDYAIYENGPLNGTVDAWAINFGYAVSDSFTVPDSSAVDGFDLWVWELPGDKALTVDWSISGVDSGTASVTDSFVSLNQFGYEIHKLTAPRLSEGLHAGTYYLTLQNAVTVQGNPLYWNENSGAGCHSSGCPSLAEESGVGTIPSEAFDVIGRAERGECVYDKPQDGFKILHSFSDTEQSPDGVAIDQAGNLYGTTSTGGDLSFGLAYEMSLKGQNWIFNPLYNFSGGTDGQNPTPVIVGPDQALYGTASGGGRYCGGKKCGLVFRLRPLPFACRSASCPWSEDVLYYFSGGDDAQGGSGKLVFDREGKAYGISPRGGAYGYGAVYELTPSLGGWTERVIYSFTATTGQPNSLLAGSDGNLYGATSTGQSGGGIVFQLVPSGDSWTERDVASFPSCRYYEPYSCSPLLIQESQGSIYGLVNHDEYQCNPGDSGFCYWAQYGTIFALSPSGGEWQFNSLDNTRDYYGYYGLDDDGYDVFHGLAIDTAGNLYASEGGFNASGQVYWGRLFQLTQPHQERNLVRFEGDNFRSLQPGARGKLYGTTSKCGTYDKGTVWQLSP